MNLHVREIKTFTVEQRFSYGVTYEVESILITIVAYLFYTFNVCENISQLDNSNNVPIL